MARAKFAYRCKLCDEPVWNRGGVLRSSTGQPQKPFCSAECRLVWRNKGLR